MDSFLSIISDHDMNLWMWQFEDSALYLDVGARVRYGSSIVTSCVLTTAGAACRTFASRTNLSAWLPQWPWKASALSHGGRALRVRRTTVRSLLPNSPTTDDFYLDLTLKLYIFGVCISNCVDTVATGSRGGSELGVS